jgi:hypothetical protein
MGMSTSLDRRVPRPAASGGSSGITLIELLVAMTIMVVVTATIIGVWFALQSSFWFSARSSDARGSARDAMSRMVREIRDSSGQDGWAAGTGIVYADGDSIAVRTAFNESGGQDVHSDAEGNVSDYLPPAGGFYYKDGTVYRWRDTDGVPGPSPGEPSSGDRVEPLMRDVVNGTGTPMFMYTCINSGSDPNAGVPLGDPYQTATPADLTSIVSVQITLRVDLNPGKAPEYMDLISTAQPRNQRQT